MQASLLLRRLRKLDAYVMRLCARIVHGAPPAHRASTRPSRGRPPAAAKQPTAHAAAVPTHTPTPRDDYPKTVFVPARPSSK